MSILGEDVPGLVDLQRVGVGGFGQVFRANQPAFRREVALKLLNGRLDDEATDRRFERECRVLGSLAGHPNIVALHDAGVTASGRPYLLMLFMPWGSLRTELERGGPLPWCTTSRSLPTGVCSQPQVETGNCGCGMPSPAGWSARSAGRTPRWSR